MSADELVEMLELQVYGCSPKSDRWRPYESPIEKAIGDNVIPQLAQGCSHTLQKTIVGFGCNYRVDFMFSTPAGKSIIECDGKNFHDFHADRERDIKILRAGFASEILRLKGPDIHHELDRCLDFIWLAMPHLFDASAKMLAAEDHKLIKSGMDAMRIQPILRVQTPRGAGEIKATNWDWKLNRK